MRWGQITITSGRGPAADPGGAGVTRSVLACVRVVSGRSLMVAGQARVDTVAVGDRTTGELRKQRHRLRGDAVVAAPALAGPTKGCAVLKVTLKGLLAHRARLVLTAVAVLIGVALVAGTLMLTDTIGQSVRHLTATAHAGVDVAVRNADDPKAGPPQAIGPQLLAAIRAVPGVGAAAGVVVAEKLQMVGRDGRPIRHQRAVNLLPSWPDDPMLASAYTLRQGRPPARGGEVVLDAATAGQGGWQLGDTLGIVGADGRVHRFRVVGVTGFAGRDSPASQLSSFDTSTVAVLQTAAAQRLLGRGDAVDEVDLRATPGVGAGTLRDREIGRASCRERV